MRRSNRTLNRILLLVVGLAALAVAVLAVWPAALRWLALVRPPRLEADTPVVLWTVVGACAVVIVLALVWILSRGRGGTRTAYSEDRTALEVAVVRDLLAQGVERHPSVIGVDASAHRLRGRTAISLRVRARRGADLPALIERMRGAVDDLDGALGRRLPLLVRITMGGLGRDRRTE